MTEPELNTLKDALYEQAHFILYQIYTGRIDSVVSMLQVVRPVWLVANNSHKAIELCDRLLIELQIGYDNLSGRAIQRKRWLKEHIQTVQELRQSYVTGKPIRL